MPPTFGSCCLASSWQTSVISSRLDGTFASCLPHDCVSRAVVVVLLGFWPNTMTESALKHIRQH